MRKASKDVIDVLEPLKTLEITWKQLTDSLGLEQRFGPIICKMLSSGYCGAKSERIIREALGLSFNQEGRIRASIPNELHERKINEVNESYSELVEFALDMKRKMDW